MSRMSRMSVERRFGIGGASERRARDGGRGATVGVRGGVERAEGEGGSCADGARERDGGRAAEGERARERDRVERGRHSGHVTEPRASSGEFGEFGGARGISRIQRAPLRPACRLVSISV